MLAKRLHIFTNTLKFLRKYSKESTDFEELLHLKEVRRLDADYVTQQKRLLTGTETVPEETKLGPPYSMPEDYRTRRVARISQRSKNVMQQGTNNTKEWILEFDTQQTWENPTIGWCSSGDSLSCLYMEFPSLCSAIRFAERSGINWYHDKPHFQKKFKKSYSDNFTWNSRTRVSTK